MTRRRIGTTIVALISVLALSATAITASASSPAELEQLPASGEFTITSAGGAFETHSGTKITCKKDKGSGKVTGVKTGKSTVTFEECTGPLGAKCTSSGASLGDIMTEANSELVWLNKASKLVGQKLTLVKEETIACLIIKVKVRGATLCPIETTNTKSTTFELICVATGGKQQYTEYENESDEKGTAVTESSIGGSFEESGLTSSETLTFSEPVEIKAT